MAVNVSGIQFRNDGFPDGLFAILRATGLDPAALEIELTESALMSSPRCSARGRGTGPRPRPAVDLPAGAAGRRRRGDAARFSPGRPPTGTEFARAAALTRNERERRFFLDRAAACRRGGRAIVTPPPWCGTSV